MGKKDTTAKPAAPAKRAAKPAAAAAAPNGAKKPAAAKQPGAPARTTKPATRAVKTGAAKAPAFTSDDVALRAYFIAEKRRHLGQPGSEHGDWLEAERQLLAESKAPKKSAR